MSRLSALALAVFALALEQPVAVAQPAERLESPPNEYIVKAVFLYNFGRYVQWPDSAFAKPDDPFVIGIAGVDAFDGALERIAVDKKVQGRQILIERFAAPDAYRPCHILFLSRSLGLAECDAFIKSTQGKGVLVVGETPGLKEHGAAANLLVEQQRVHVEINPMAARASYLLLDAKLLALGKPAGAPPQVK